MNEITEQSNSTCTNSERIEFTANTLNGICDSYIVLKGTIISNADNAIIFRNYERFISWTIGINKSQVDEVSEVNLNMLIHNLSIVTILLKHLEVYGDFLGIEQFLIMM